MRALIVGGGVIGLSIAYFLSKKKIETVVLDADKPGAASFASGGMLEPLALIHEKTDWLETALQSFQLYPDFIADIEQASSLPTGFARSGIVYLNRTLSHYEPYLAQLQNYGLSVTARDEHSAFCPETAQLEPQKLCEALKRACEKNNVTFIQDEVTAFTFSGKTIQSVQTKVQTLHADIFILAAGAWSNVLFQQLNITAPDIQPVKGQIVTLQADQTLPHILHDPGNLYLIPRSENRITIGATVEHAGFNSTIDDNVTADLIARAEKIYPALKGAHIIEARAGFRPYAANERFFLGAAPEYDNLQIATGHYRHGILLAPLTAQKIASNFK